MGRIHSLIEVGRITAARDAARSCLETQPDGAFAEEALYTIAWCERRLGAREKAREAVGDSNHGRLARFAFRW